MRPPSTTTMRSASRTVESRCAITSEVRPARAVSSARCTAASDSESRWAVASSRITTDGALSSSRASARRCFSPPDSRWPRSPTTVSRPSGQRTRRGRAPGRRAERPRARRRWRRGGRRARFARIGVVEHVRLLRDHADARRAASSSVTSRTSTPPMRTVPSWGSYRRATRAVIVVLPAPLGPTSATMWPGATAQRHVVQHRALADLAVATAADGLQRGQRHLVGARVAEGDVVELDAERAGRHGRRRPRRSSTSGGQVEHLEDALEAHQRAHDVDPDVGQRRDRAVEAAEQRREGHQRARSSGRRDAASRPPTP